MANPFESALSIPATGAPADLGSDTAQAALSLFARNAAAPNSTVSCVFAGDSLTSGFGVAAGADWPSRLMLHPQFAGGVGVKYNTAVSGRLLSNLVSGYATEVYPYRPTAGERVYLFVWIGANDYPTSVNTTTWLASLNSYLAQARADGFTVVLFTIMRRGETSISGAREVDRGTLNAGIRASTNYDILVEPDRAFHYQFGGFWWQDYVHLNAAGYALLATHVGNCVAAWRMGRVEPTLRTPDLGARIQITSDITLVSGVAQTVSYTLAGAGVGLLARAELVRGDGVLLPATVQKNVGCTSANTVGIALYQDTGSNIVIPTGSAWSITVET